MFRAILKPVYRCQLPSLPDSSPAYLPVDQSPANEHQLNFHGWPANNVQEYMNTEDVKMKEMLLQKLGVVPQVNNPDRSLSPQEMIALCPSKYAQTANEYLFEGLRIDKIRADIKSARDRIARKSDDSSQTIKFEKDDDPNAPK